MNPITRLLILVLTLSVAFEAHAQTIDSIGRVAPDEIIAIGKRETHIRLVVVKDPTLASILSIGTPGLGHIYVGRWQRGFAFLGGVAASIVSVGLAGDNLNLTVKDYDLNGNNVVEHDEYQAWEDKPRRDFGDLSTTRQAVILGGLGTAIGLYVWAIVDANHVAKDHNRTLYRELSNISFRMGVDPRGRTAGMLSFAF
jgi:hypothetical protein